LPSKIDYDVVCWLSIVVDVIVAAAASEEINVVHQERREIKKKEKVVFGREVGKKV